MRLTKASPKAVRYACLHFHYAKAVPVNTLGYNVYNDNDEWCGVVLFGSGANNYIGNEYNLKQGQVFELVRVALNGKQSCTSQCVSMALKALRRDCPLCRLVVSYADCDQNHLGTIYQATNWLYVGTMMQNEHDSSWIIHGKRYHGRIISDWVRNRGGYKDLHVCSSYKNTMTLTQNRTSRKVRENISCRSTRRCADRLSRCESHTRKTMPIGARLTARSLSTMIV